MARLRVLVADDSQFMRVAYKRILETQEHLEVVGMAADGEEAVNQAELLKPEVAILDIRMPKINGIEVARRISTSQPGIGIVIISAYDDTEYVVELLKGGAKGKAYLLKTSIDDIDALIGAVEAVAAGRTVLDAALVERLFARANLHESRSDNPLNKLTVEERKVLSLLVEGHSNPVIAEALGVDDRIVKQLSESIYEKLTAVLYAGG